MPFHHILTTKGKFYGTKTEETAEIVFLQWFNIIGATEYFIDHAISIPMRFFRI